MEKIDVKGFISKATILFIRVVVKVFESSRFRYSRTVGMYVVFENKKEDYLQVYFDHKSRKIPISLIKSVKKVEAKDIINFLDDVMQGGCSCSITLETPSTYVERYCRIELYKPGEEFPS